MKYSDKKGSSDKKKFSSDRSSSPTSKLSRRFSIIGFFNKKNQNQKNEQHTTDKLPPVERRSTLADLSLEGSQSSSTLSSLRRSKSLANVVGKFFKKNKEDLEDRRAPSLVSSFHVKSNDPQHNETIKSNSTTSPLFKENSINYEEPNFYTQLSDDRPPSTNSFVSGMAKERIAVEPLLKDKRFSLKEKNIDLLALSTMTSRCVLACKIRLLQGTMTLNDKHLIFDCKIVKPSLKLSLPYENIVAVFPNGDRTGIRMATQTKCLDFEGFPERDLFLEVLMRKWIEQCRHFLLEDEQLSSKDIGRKILNLSLKSEDLNSQNQKNSTVELKRTPSFLKRKDDFNNKIMSEKNCFRATNVFSQLKHEILNMEVQAIPRAVVGILFGLSGAKVSFAETFFVAGRGTVLEETEWTDNKENGQPCIKSRSIIMSMPDAFKNSSMMRVEIHQKLLHESADAIAVEGTAWPKKTTFGENYECHLRWSIRRTGKVTENSEIRLSAAVILNGTSPLPFAVVEEKLIGFIKKNFGNMLMALQTRLKVENIDEQRIIKENYVEIELREKFEIFFRELLFLTAYRLYENLQRKFNLSKFMRNYLAPLITVLLFLLLLILLKWIVFPDIKEYNLRENETFLIKWMEFSKEYSKNDVVDGSFFSLDNETNTTAMFEAIDRLGAFL